MSEKNYGRGNVDLNDRPKVRNPDGTISTVYSMTFGPEQDGSYVLVPGVRHGLNRQMTEREAYDWYRKTGQHLGKFKTVKDADKYAVDLHKSQEKQYVRPNTGDDMTPTEQKRALQEMGLVPPDDDELMPFPETAPEEAKQERGFADHALAFGRGYAKASGIDIPEPTQPTSLVEDPKEKLKKLLTPEFMQSLRARAGVGGEPR